MFILNVNEAWTNFKEMFTEVLNVVAPVKCVRLKQRTEMWFTGEILEKISQRDKAHINFLRSRNDETFGEYKNLRNRCQRLIDKCKRNYVKNQLEENQGNAKRLWQATRHANQDKIKQ